MDLLIKYYFEKFAELPRNTLHDRRNRRSMVEYINTLIEGCRRGEECDAEKTAREAIIAIIRFHEESRSSNGQVCMMGKYHNVLYVAARLCHLWQLKDTPTVATLLEHIYECEKTFERIFIGAIFGGKAPHFIAGWKSDFDDQEDNLRAAVYFIDHATAAGLQFDWGGTSTVRFIDLPIESCAKAAPLKICIELNLPDKAHILLRYGALADDAFDRVRLVEVILRKLLEFFHVYPYNIVSCLQLLLRVIPTIEIDLDSGSAHSCQKDAIMEKYSCLIEDGLIPVSRCGLQPPELKHLCRCTIRRRLWRNFQLPAGIRLLPVPESLRTYIDIMID